MSSIAPYLYAVPLFVPEARSFVPACACAGAPRARGRQGWPSRLLCLLLQPRQATPGRVRARRDTQAARGDILFVLMHSNLRSLLRTAQAMRASLLASAIASTLWCSRFLAASIQGLSPWRSQVVGFTSTTQAACTNRTRRYRLA